MTETLDHNFEPFPKTDHLPPPLWSTLERAFLQGRSPGLNDRYGYAAEIRSFSSYVQGFISSGGDIFQLLNVLEDEAKRAEGGHN